MSTKVLVPISIQEKIASFPEYRMSAHKVAVLLADGRMFEDVIVAWESEIVSVGGKKRIPFAGEEIVDVYDRSREES
jgi:hypothetical protein